MHACNENKYNAFSHPPPLPLPTRTALLLLPFFSTRFPPISNSSSAPSPHSPTGAIGPPTHTRPPPTTSPPKNLTERRNTPRPARRQSMAAAATTPPRPASQLPSSTSAVLPGSWHRRSLHQLPPHTLPLRNPFMPSTAVVDAPNPPLLTAAPSAPAAALASTAPPLITVAEPPPAAAPLSHGAATLDGTFVTRAIRVRAASAAAHVGSKGGWLLPDRRRRKRAGEGGRLYHLADPTTAAATAAAAKHLAVLVGGGEGAADRRPPAAQRRRLHSASAESAAAAAAAAVAAGGDVVTVPRLHAAERLRLSSSVLASSSSTSAAFESSPSQPPPPPTRLLRPKRLLSVPALSSAVRRPGSCGGGGGGGDLQQQRRWRRSRQRRRLRSAPAAAAATAEERRTPAPHSADTIVMSTGRVGTPLQLLREGQKAELASCLAWLGGGGDDDDNGDDDAAAAAGALVSTNGGLPPPPHSPCFSTVSSCGSATSDAATTAAAARRSNGSCRPSALPWLPPAAAPVAFEETRPSALHGDSDEAEANNTVESSRTGAGAGEGEGEGGADTTSAAAGAADASAAPPFLSQAAAAEGQGGGTEEEDEEKEDDASHVAAAAAAAAEAAKAAAEAEAEAVLGFTPAVLELFAPPPPPVPTPPTPAMQFPRAAAAAAAAAAGGASLSSPKGAAGAARPHALSLAKGEGSIVRYLKERVRAASEEKAAAELDSGGPSPADEGTGAGSLRASAAAAGAAPKKKSLIFAAVPVQAPPPPHEAESEVQRPPSPPQTPPTPPHPLPPRLVRIPSSPPLHAPSVPALQTQQQEPPPPPSPQQPQPQPPSPQQQPQLSPSELPPWLPFRVRWGLGAEPEPESAALPPPASAEEEEDPEAAAAAAAVARPPPPPPLTTPSPTHSPPAAGSMSPVAAQSPHPRHATSTTPTAAATADGGIFCLQGTAVRGFGDGFGQRDSLEDSLDLFALRPPPSPPLSPLSPDSSTAPTPSLRSPQPRTARSPYHSQQQQRAPPPPPLHPQPWRSSTQTPASTTLTPAGTGSIAASTSAFLDASGSLHPTGSDGVGGGSGRCTAGVRTRVLAALRGSSAPPAAGRSGSGGSGGGGASDEASEPVSGRGGGASDEAVIDLRIAELRAHATRVDVGSLTGYARVVGLARLRDLRISLARSLLAPVLCGVQPSSPSPGALAAAAAAAGSGVGAGGCASANGTKTAIVIAVDAVNDPRVVPRASVRTDCRQLAEAFHLLGYKVVCLMAGEAGALPPTRPNVRKVIDYAYVTSSAVIVYYIGLAHRGRLGMTDALPEARDFYLLTSESVLGPDMGRHKATFLRRQELYPSCLHANLAAANTPAGGGGLDSATQAALSAGAAKAGPALTGGVSAASSVSAASASGGGGDASESTHDRLSMLTVSQACQGFCTIAVVVDALTVLPGSLGSEAGDVGVCHVDCRHNIGGSLNGAYTRGQAYLMTYYVLRGLRGGALRDRVLTVNSLNVYLDKKLKQYGVACETTASPLNAGGFVLADRSSYLSHPVLCGDRRQAKQRRETAREIPTWAILNVTLPVAVAGGGLGTSTEMASRLVQKLSRVAKARASVGTDAGAAVGAVPLSLRGWEHSNTLSVALAGTGWGWLVSDPARRLAAVAAAETAVRGGAGSPRAVVTSHLGCGDAVFDASLGAAASDRSAAFTAFVDGLRLRWRAAAVEAAAQRRRKAGKGRETEEEEEVAEVAKDRAALVAMEDATDVYSSALPCPRRHQKYTLAALRVSVFEGAAEVEAAEVGERVLLKVLTSDYGAHKLDRALRSGELLPLVRRVGAYEFSAAADYSAVQDCAARQIQGVYKSCTRSRFLVKVRLCEASQGCGRLATEASERLAAARIGALLTADRREVVTAEESALRLDKRAWEAEEVCALLASMARGVATCEGKGRGRLVAEEEGVARVLLRGEAWGRWVLEGAQAQARRFAREAFGLGCTQQAQRERIERDCRVSVVALQKFRSAKLAA